jgi:hypothetical protein
MRFGIFIAMLMLATQLYAETNIHTIQLKHRLASDLVSEIEPFLPETATIRAYGNKLILKSDRATAANVELLLAELDVAQQTVVITVMRSTDDFQQHKGAASHVEVEAGDGVKGSVAINRWSTKRGSDTNQQYRTRGLAGQPISISLGEDIPQHQQLIFVDPYGGVAVTEDTNYISIDNGFKAVPFLLPNQQVKVEIHPFFSQLSVRSGEISQTNVLTTVVGPVGQWLEIGRLTENAQVNDQTVTTYRSHGSQQQIIYLKVETSSN